MRGGGAHALAARRRQDLLVFALLALVGVILTALGGRAYLSTAEDRTVTVAGYYTHTTGTDPVATHRMVVTTTGETYEVTGDLAVFGDPRQAFAFLIAHQGQPVCVSTHGFAAARYVTAVRDGPCPQGGPDAD